MTVDVEIKNRINRCRKILDADPNSQIFAALAEAYRKKGDLEEAFRVCQRGLRLHAGYGSAHVVMAKINLDRGLYDWAEAEVSKAKEVDGNNRNIELLLAEIHIYKAEYQAAIKLLKKLKLSDPQNQHVQRLLDIAMKIPQEQAEQMGSPVAESIDQTVIENKSDAPVQDEPKPVEIDTTEILRQTLSIDQVSGALFVNTEGLVIESEWRTELDVGTCGAVLAEVNKLLNQELMKTSFGRVGSVLIETPLLIFYLIQVTTGMYLVVADARVNLGTLRMKMADLIAKARPS